MFKEKTIINKNGFIVENKVLVDENNNILFTNVVLKDGEQLVKLFNSVSNIDGNYRYYLKPQWNGTEWIETATQEELNTVYPPIVVQPSQDEILRAKILKDNASMQLQLSAQQKLNADILLKLAKVGGSANV